MLHIMLISTFGDEHEVLLLSEVAVTIYPSSGHKLLFDKLFRF